MTMSLKTKFTRVTPGRELDALVSEKVMGRRWRTFFHNAYLLPLEAIEGICFRGSSWTEGRNAQWDGECIILSDLKHLRVPDHSTDITAAWQVWLKLRENPEKFGMFIEALFTLSDRFEGDCDIDGLITRLDPALICRAALLSLEL